MIPFLKRPESRSLAIIYDAVLSRLPTLILIFLISVIGIVISLVPPLFFRELIDVAIPSKDGHLVAWLLAGMVLIPILVLVVNSLQEYLKTILGHRVCRALSGQLFSHMMRVRLDSVDKVKPGEFVNRLTIGEEEIGYNFVSNHVASFASHVVLLLATLTVMFYMHWQLSLITFFAFPPAQFVAARLARHVHELEEEYINLGDEGAGRLANVFNGIREVRAFQAENYEVRRFDQWQVSRWSVAVKALVGVSFVERLSSGSIVNVTIGLVYGYGAYECMSGNLTVGTLVAVVAYVPRVYSSMQSLISAQFGAQRLTALTKKYDEMLGLPAEEDSNGVHNQKHSFVHSAHSEGTVVKFQNVSFHYDRGAGLDNLTFQVDSGEFLGIVGPSGGGKTTLIDLIMGFYEPDEGTIKFDGIDTREIPPSHLRGDIGWVPQEVILWDASIESNIRYPEIEVGFDEVQQAAQTAGLHEFIMSQPEGYQTQVGNHGLALSGGERQRVAIARAMLRKPRLLLMDEATSAVDALTEERIRNAVNRARVGRTTIVVAHRLSTIIDADRILVIDGGHITEIGTPHELLARGGLFAQLHRAQSLERSDQDAGI